MQRTLLPKTKQNAPDVPVLNKTNNDQLSTSLPSPFDYCLNSLQPPRKKIKPLPSLTEYPPNVSKRPLRPLAPKIAYSSASIAKNQSQSPSSTTGHPNSPKASLRPLAPAPPRALHAPDPFIIETSCDQPAQQPRKCNREQSQTGSQEIRLYPKLLDHTPTDPKRTQYLTDQALTFLQQELNRRVEASKSFPPHVSLAHIRSAVARYEETIEAASKRAVCASCGRLFDATDIHSVVNEDPRLRLLRGKLDPCGQHHHIWNLCSTCLTSLSQQTIPRFSASNLVNVTFCQHYPSVLEDLTPVEECLIAKCHPVGIVLKLRPGGHSSPVSYRAIRGHFIVMPQDPEPLLHILPSPDLSLDSLIKVLWAGKHPPADADLRPFLLVRKHKVLAALQYLVQNNKVYQDVDINHSMIDDWTDDFIPPELRDNLICLDEPDSGEREGYTLSLRTGNYENDLQAAQDGGFDAGESEPLTTGSVSTDVNGERQNPDKRLLNTLREFVSNSFQPGNEHTAQQCNVQHSTSCNRRNVPVIFYTMRGQITLLDQWSDPRYFTAAFPTLFPTGIGGHLEDRPFPISLGSFMEWALRHHSRRSVLSTSTQFL